MISFMPQCKRKKNQKWICVHPLNGLLDADESEQKERQHIGLASAGGGALGSITHAILEQAEASRPQSSRFKQASSSENIRPKQACWVGRIVRLLERKEAANS